jgi:hypothetical protein
MQAFELEDIEKLTPLQVEALKSKIETLIRTDPGILGIIRGKYGPVVDRMIVQNATPQPKAVRAVV